MKPKLKLVMEQTLIKFKLINKKIERVVVKIKTKN